MARKTDKTRAITPAVKDVGCDRFADFLKIDKKFGVMTAVFAAGHSMGWADGITRAADRAIPALDLLMRRAFDIYKRAGESKPLRDLEKRAYDYAISFFKRSQAKAAPMFNALVKESPKPKRRRKKRKNPAAGLPESFQRRGFAGKAAKKRKWSEAPFSRLLIKSKPIRKPAKKKRK